jgi:hypothetical protein
LATTAAASSIAGISRDWKSMANRAEVSRSRAGTGFGSVQAGGFAAARLVVNP